MSIDAHEDPNTQFAHGARDERTAQSIVVAIHSLRGGGSEHAAAMMASYWADQGRQITLVTLDDQKNDSIKISPKVERVGLGLMQESSGLFQAVMANSQRIKALRKAFVDADPDVLVSLVDQMNVLSILAARKAGLPIVVCERTDPRHHQMSGLWQWLRRRTYPKADRIVVQTRSVAENWAPGVARTTPVSVIPNAVRSLEASGAEESPLDCECRWILAVGRLSVEKGMDRILTGFSQAVSGEGGAEKLGSDWSLAIVGDGPERHTLETQAKELDLVNRVQFVGWVEDLAPYYKQADLFVSASHYEGFPNSLLEAMAFGVPSIAVDCESGPADIIRDRHNGILLPTPDVAANIAKAIRLLAEDDSLRTSIAANSLEVKERFSQEAHFALWDDLFGELKVLRARNPGE